MNDQQNIDITRQTVLNFRFFDANAMMALATDLSLSLPIKMLLLLRDHFRMREGRDPIVGELQFLSALFALRQKCLTSAEVISVMGNDEEQRSFADILRMRTALKPATPTFLSLMDTAGRYIERSGLAPYHQDLICGTTVEMAARAGGQNPSIALDVGNVSAMLAPAKSAPSPRAGMLVMLLPTGAEDFPLETARFFASHKGLGLSFVAAPEDEGAFLHLLSLGEGFCFDLAPFARDLPDNDPLSVLTLGKGTVLFRAPEEALPRLFAEGAPIAVCGMLNGSQRVQVRNGPETRLSLPLGLFSTLWTPRSISLQLPPHAEKTVDCRYTTSASHIMGGVAAQGGCTDALLSLIGEMAAQGADIKRTTLTAVLAMPFLDQDNTLVPYALPTVLDFHRICAELALSTHAPRVLPYHRVSVPTLTVFACADRGALREADFCEAWQSATAHRDFAALRRLLRPF